MYKRKEHKSISRVCKGVETCWVTAMGVWPQGKSQSWSKTLTTVPWFSHICVTLSKTLNLSEAQVPLLHDGDNNKQVVLFRMKGIMYVDHLAYCLGQRLLNRFQEETRPGQEESGGPVQWGRSLWVTRVRKGQERTVYRQSLYASRRRRARWYTTKCACVLVDEST